MEEHIIYSTFDTMRHRDPSKDGDIDRKHRYEGMMGILDLCSKMDDFPPQLQKLVGCPQHPEWHPEGDVWVHTRMATANAAKVIMQVQYRWRPVLLWSALCHDLGKPDTVDPELLTCYGHAEAGVEPTRELLLSMGYEGYESFIAKVQLQVRHHLSFNQLVANNMPIKAWRRLYRKIGGYDAMVTLAWLHICDWAARPNRDPFQESYEHETIIPGRVGLEWAQRVKDDEEEKEREPKPIVSGKDLIKAGLQPGPLLGKALKAAHAAQLAGETDKLKLMQTAMLEASKPQ